MTSTYKATLTFWHVLKTAVCYFHQTDDLCQKVQTDDTKRERNIDTFEKRSLKTFLQKELLHLTLLKEMNK